uniref:NADH dehydrogenase subunit 5 n=1 Tax=Glaucosphaera vacuolata TaxID=38265 RepID=UPI001FCE2475|nr:NADH dehydrogenase subunit 5 [Glaucosphaera vacuolata]UNJ18764.1 NADH dehydrogenase subunit 5 [Glaucosphaera vacuolata]
MYLLIIFSPLISALVIAFFGRFFGKEGSSLLSCICIITSFLLSTVAFIEVGILNSKVYFSCIDWIRLGEVFISWGFLFDSLSVVMLVIITFISSLVHMYSVAYMNNDPHRPRFMSYLSLFTFFMLILVTADNLLQMFVGWEGVGLSSYLLINFWFTRLNANQSSIKALVVNRVGDFGLSLGIFSVFYLFRTLDYTAIFGLVPFFESIQLKFFTVDFYTLTFITFFFFVGAVGKSAQLGLHTWLPDAMEGPTPVSALIHAATMVTAGVFLMVRCSPILEYTYTTMFIITIVGACTTLFASTTAVFQNDLKRVIAFSTCSQLGYMIFACGISSYQVGMFHLFNHAFFKALLFLSAGSVIHAMSDEQDMRRMGGLFYILPLSYVMILIGSLALTGFPFLSGFYSKDYILELVLILRHSILSDTHRSFAYWLGCLSVLFTSFYSFRLLFLTFINGTNATKSKLSNAHEGTFLIYFPLIVLAFFSMWVGFLMKDLFIGVGTTFWENSLLVLPIHLNDVEIEENLILHLKLIPFYLTTLGFIIALSSNYFYTKFLFNKQMLNMNRWVLFLLNKRWYWDKLYNSLIVNVFFKFGYHISFKILDRGFIEIFGPYGVVFIVPKWTNKITELQSGYIIYYLFLMTLSICFFIAFFIFKDFNLFLLFFDSNQLSYFVLFFLSNYLLL